MLEGKSQKITNASDHLANERTFLAWLRTSIGIMAFGFVVVKFALFLKQVSLVLGKQNQVQQNGYSSFIGILLVAVGAVTTIFSYLRYKRVQKQLNNNAFKSSSGLIIVLTILILLIGMSLVTYLFQSIK